MNSVPSFLVDGDRTGTAVLGAAALLVVHEDRAGRR
jgi:hypothetical protein